MDKSLLLDVYEVLKQWTWVNSMTRFRPPPLLPPRWGYFARPKRTWQVTAHPGWDKVGFTGEFTFRFYRGHVRNVMLPDDISWATLADNLTTNDEWTLWEDQRRQAVWGH